MTERASFAAELRRARETRGLTLDDLAEQTKVSATYFAGLERGDLSRWPSGIFRRAFVRGYARAVGLDPEVVLARFVRLFPDPVEDPKGAARAESAARLSEAVAADADETPRPAERGSGLRLVLDNTRPVPPPADRRSPNRVSCVAIDAALALVPAAVAGVVGGLPWFWVVAACLSIASHGIAGVVLGRSLGSWLTARTAAPTPVARAAASDRRRPDLVAATAAAARRRQPRQAPPRVAGHAHRLH